MMVRMFWNRGDAWGYDVEDVLDQGGCVGGMMLRMFWSRGDAWGG